MLFQLIYASRAVVPPSEAHENIVMTCRRNNERDHISGLLLSDGIRYLQALEGAEDLVLDCFGRIRADRRHYGSQVMSTKHVEFRQFGHWALAYKSVEETNHPGDFTAAVKVLVADVTDPHILAFFIGFAALSDRG